MRTQARIRTGLPAWLPALAVALVVVPAGLIAPAAPAQAIIGGTPSAHLFGQVQIEQDGQFGCTGTLIAPDWVLTARHCTEGHRLLTVRVGSLQRSGGEIRTVVVRARHPDADVGLLQLDTPVNQLNLVMPYEDRIRPPINSNVGIHGWGDTGGGQLPHELRGATLRVNDSHADPPIPGDSPPRGTILMTGLQGVPAPGDSGAGVIYNHRVVGVYNAGGILSAAIALESINGWIWRATRQRPGYAQLAGSNLGIMPLGDSITYGIGSSKGSGYRHHVWNRLEGSAKSLDLVGTRQSGNLPDRDNEGHSGAMIGQIARAADAAVPLTKPNVVLLHAGTNDMDRGDAAAAPAALGSLIDQVLRDAPQATVLVSTLVPSRNTVVNGRIAAFNKQIPGLVAQRASTGKHVGLVDMSEVTTADLADDLHPNDAGYDKMGDAFTDAVLTAAAQGWIADSSAPNCLDTPGRWISRGQIASGAGQTRNETVEFADIDGDRRDDYLLVDHLTGAVRAWINAGGDQVGKPGWIERGQIASGVDLGEGDVDFADINGDRRDDYLVFEAKSGRVRAWINVGGDQGGKPGWIERGQIASGVKGVARPVFADIDGDARADYLMADPRTGVVRAWINAGGDQGGKPGWIERGQIASGTAGGGEGPLFANVDCDQRADYLTFQLRSGAVDAWLNRGGDQDGKPGWIARGRIASGPGIGGGEYLEFADIDGDGRDDYLLVSAANGSVRAWINKGGDPV